ncbi:hypothetical protein HDU86_001428 [Geranomyces michiganensis]|nr:hypothetical protein HDU86_001428 [Geranomyces michiganensis]
MAYYRPQPRPVPPLPHTLHRTPYPYADALPPSVAGPIATATAPALHRVRGPPPFWDSRPAAWEEQRDYLMRDPRFPAGVPPPGQHLGRWPSQQLDGAYTFPPRQSALAPYESASWAPPPHPAPFNKGRQLPPHGFESDIDRNVPGRVENGGLTIVIRDGQDGEPATPVIDLTEEGEIIEPSGHPPSRALVRIREVRPSPPFADAGHHNGLKRKFPNGWDMESAAPPPPPPPPLPPSGPGRIAINPKFYAQFHGGQLGRAPDSRNMGLVADRGNAFAAKSMVPPASSPLASGSLTSPPATSTPPVGAKQVIPYNPNSLTVTKLSSSRSTAFSVDQHPWKIRSTRQLAARPRPDSSRISTPQVEERDDGKKERIVFSDAWVSPEEMRAKYLKSMPRP